MKEISVIIPSYNYPETIKHTLTALLDQKDAPDYEVIVVDSSDDGITEEVIRTYIQRGVKLVKSGIRVMPALQRNIGVEHAEGNLLVFIDSDVIPGSKLLRQFYDANRNGCRAGCGSLRVADLQKFNKVANAQYFLQFNEYFPTGKIRIKDFPAGASVFCDKGIFSSVKGYPEIRAAEDVLFGLKVNEITDLWFLPHAVSEHIFRESMKNLESNQKMLGKYAAVYRKGKGRRFPIMHILLFVVYPLFIFIKMARIIPRIKSAGMGYMKTLFSIFPVFILGLHYWALGFINGVTERN